METDILSSLNTNGTGLNIKQLSTDLSTAEYSPKISIQQDRADSAELSLSALDRLRGQFESLQSSLATVGEASATTISSNSAAVVLTSEITSELVEGDTTIDITQMALPQVLAFGGFTAESEVLTAGTLTIDFGEWDDSEPSVFTADTSKTQQTITIAEGTTLAELAEQLTAVDGMAAQIVDVGDGTFSLGVLADYGRKNAIRITAEDVPGETTETTTFDLLGNPTTTTTTTPPSGTSLAAFDMTDQVEDVQVQAAANAELTVNGIAITRQTNDIDDVIPGVSFTIAGYNTTTATVSVGVDTTAAETAVQGLVDALNGSINLLTTLSDRGFSTGEKGDLAGDTAVNALKRQMESIISDGIPGYGDRPLYLADIGIRTERDGSLSLDTAALEDTMLERPEVFEGILRDGLNSTTAGVTLSGTPGTTAVPGRYAFSRDADTGEASLNGITLTNTGSENGITTYSVDSGPLRGVKIEVEDSVEAANIDFGRSFITNMTERLDDWLSSSGVISRRETAYSDQLSDAQIEIEELEGEQTSRKDYYLGRFTQMELIVSTLNATGEYLENLIDSLNAND